MHYGFVPSQPNLHSRFSGYTENPYTFQRYIEMMSKFHVKNELRNDGYKNKSDCMNDMKYFMEFNGIDPTGVFFGRNNLFTITGKGINPKVIALTDVIYEQFTETYYVEPQYRRSELYKLFSDLYRLCSKMSVKYLYSYINNTPETKIFIDVIKRIHEIWEMNNIYKLSSSDIHSPESLLGLNENGEYKLWDVIDQATQIELYMASEIVKNNLLYDTDSVFGNYNYDFDIR